MPRLGYHLVKVPKWQNINPQSSSQNTQFFVTNLVHFQLKLSRLTQERITTCRVSVHFIYRQNWRFCMHNNDDYQRSAWFHLKIHKVLCWSILTTQESHWSSRFHPVLEKHLAKTASVDDTHVTLDQVTLNDWKVGSARCRSNLPYKNMVCEKFTSDIKVCIAYLNFFTDPTSGSV